MRFLYVLLLLCLTILPAQANHKNGNQFRLNGFHNVQRFNNGFNRFNYGVNFGFSSATYAVPVMVQQQPVVVQQVQQPLTLQADPSCSCNQPNTLQLQNQYSIPSNGFRFNARPSRVNIRFGNGFNY